MTQPTVATNSTAGRLLSLLIIPAGVALWVALWSAGFMTSLVAFGVAYGAVWLFKVGAKREPARADAFFLAGVILATVALSFIGGMVSDTWAVWTQEFSEAAGFFSGEFWSFVSENLMSTELWSAYVVDLLLAAVFGVLGAGLLVRDLLRPATPQTEDTLEGTKEG